MLISIIVPIYNVEAYLEKCIKSIVDQTYTNLEIILVDDGSPDQCGIMCDRWAAKDNLINVIHKKNGGLSDARNSGLAMASGEYICFVDSDDWINLRYVELLYTAINKFQVPIAACDVTPFYEGNNIAVDIEEPISYGVYTSEGAIETLINGTHFRAVAWNKLIHRDLLLGEEFPVGKLHEDEFFSYRILAKAEKLAYVDVPLYYYLQRQGSIMTSISIRHLDSLEAGLQRLTFLEKHYPRLYRTDKVTFCTACLLFYRGVMFSSYKEKSAYIRKIRKARMQVRFQFFEILSYSVKDMIYILGSRFFPNMLCMLLNKKGRKDCE